MFKIIIIVYLIFTAFPCFGASYVKLIDGKEFAYSETSFRASGDEFKAVKILTDFRCKNLDLYNSNFEENFVYQFKVNDVDIEKFKHLRASLDSQMKSSCQNGTPLINVFYNKCFETCASEKFKKSELVRICNDACAATRRRLEDEIQIVGRMFTSGEIVERKECETKKERVNSSSLPKTKSNTAEGQIDGFSGKASYGVPK